MILSLFFMLVLFIAASSFIVLIPVETRAALRSERQIGGAYAAEAGVSDAIQFAQTRLNPNSNSSNNSVEPLASGVYPSVAERTIQVDDEWAYRWELSADAETFPNGSNPIRGYTVRSVAFRNGTAEREVVANIIQEPLTRFQVLYDTWPNNIFLPARNGDEPFVGPVHANEIMNLWVPEGLSYWDNNGDDVDRRFIGGVSTAGSFTDSGDGFGWRLGNYSGNRPATASIVNPALIPYDENGPIEARYSRLAEGGRDDVIAGTDRVELPTNTFSIEEAAWGFNNPQPAPSVSGTAATTGVTINVVQGSVQGVYIEGDVEEIQLGVGGTEPAVSLSDPDDNFPTNAPLVNYGQNSWFKVELPIANQNSIDASKNVTIVSVDELPITLPSGATLNGSTISGTQTIDVGSTLVRRANGDFESYPSRLNGTTFVNGDIQNLWGLNKGRRTFAVSGEETNLAEAHQITIGGREFDSDNGVGRNRARDRFSVAAGEKGLVQFGVSDGDGDGVLDPPITAENALGLVGRNVLVSYKLAGINGVGQLSEDGWDNSHPEGNPLYIFASVIGGLSGPGGDGIFGLERAPLFAFPGQGDFPVQIDGGSSNIGVHEDNGNFPRVTSLQSFLGNGFRYQFGSEIVVDATAWSSVNGNGVLVAGLGDGDTIFDEAAALNPPPFFPSSTRFLVQGIQERFISTGETL